MTIRLEPRLTVARWLSPLATILALVVALVISGFVIAFGTIICLIPMGKLRDQED